MNTQNNADFNELLDCINNVDHNLSIEKIPEKVLLLMGETKAGKTTLLYYLLKKKLILEVNQMGVTHMKPEAIYFEAQIGDGYQSTTVYPNIPTEIDEDECLLIDMPGIYLDTKDSMTLDQCTGSQISTQSCQCLGISTDYTLVLSYHFNLYKVMHYYQLYRAPALFLEILSSKDSEALVLSSLKQKTKKEQMQQLREMETDDVLSEVLNTFDERNTYIFCSNQPNLQEGAELKKQIIRENAFYQIEQSFQNILSENYADIIIGKGDREEFNQYLQKVVQELCIYLPELINTFTLIVRFQYKQLLTICSKYSFDYNQFYKQIQKLKKIGLQVPSQWTSLRESIQIEDIQTLLKCFASKMMKIQGQTKDKNQRNVLRIKSFVSYSNQLSQQQCGVSDLLRNAIHTKLKNCFILIQTLNSISSKLKIEESIDSFFRSQPLNNAITSYYSFIIDNNLLAKLMEIPEAKSLMHLDQHFREIITSYNPNYVPNPSEVITKIVEQRTRDKLTSKQFQKTFLETSKSIIPITIHKPHVRQLIPRNSSQLQQLTDQIQRLPNNHHTLGLLLQSLKNMRNIKISELKYAKFLNKLLTKSVNVLSSLSLVEQAIIFSISIPDYNQTQQLLQNGIKFALITPEFIKAILLPYFSFVEYDFELLQKLHSFLQLRAESLDQIMEIQQGYVDLLGKMRKNMSQGNFEYQTKRYNLQIIQSLIIGEASIELLARAEQRCEVLRKNSLCSNNVQRELARLTNIT